MDRRGSQILWAILLIVGGMILLLLNLGVFEAYEPVVQYVVAGALALGGIGFFAWALSSRMWQRIIPAWTLIALAVMVLLGLGESPNTRLIAATLFWGLAAAFLHIYLWARAEHWWALIPGGFLLVLGTVVALSGVVQSLEMLAAVLFGGIGLVFILLYLVSGEGRHWWALLPGSILLLFGFFALTGSRFGENAIVRWWPLLVVAAGILAAWRAYTRPAIDDAPFERHHAPPMVTPAASASRQGLGDYTQPAPGASAEVLPEPD